MAAVSETLRAALGAHRSGRFAQAEKLYRQILRVDPKHADALHLVGVIAHQTGRHKAAVDSIRRAIRSNPHVAAFHVNLGATYHALGELDRAIASYRRALRIEPASAEAHNNLGNTLEAQGKLDEAIASYERALQINSDYADAHYNLANVLASQHRLDEAAAEYQHAVSAKPDYAAAHNNLGITLTRQGKLDEAAASFQHALKLEPDRTLRELRVATLCPAVFQSSQEIDRYRRELLAYVGGFAARDLSIDFRELNTSGAEPPLNLMCHGRNDRPIKEAYANIFRNCIPETAATVRSGRPRIGFVVTDDHEAVFLWFMRRVLEHWNTDLFDVFIVCSRRGSAEVRKTVENAAIQVLTIPERFDQIVDTIREARFDLLYYWEVGTDAVNYFLPFFRLAPVQCASTGVPATSGIPQMDYFISWELVEPEDSDGYYTERLIRAKANPFWPLRVELPEDPRTRESFGFTADQHLYLCAQKMEKFHPDFDPILAGILRRDESGLVVVVEDRYQHAAHALRSRFAATIADVADRIVFLPRQAFSDYLGLVAASDVLLDTLHYCGGTTTFHGLCLGKPIVTLPSRFLAGRATFACYQKLGVSDCIASDADQYVEIAVRLGTDVDYRKAVGDRISATSGVLFEGLESVRELERVFQRLIHDARSQ